MVTSSQILNLTLGLKNTQECTFYMEIEGTGKPGFFILKLGLEPELGFCKKSGFPPSLAVTGSLDTTNLNICQQLQPKKKSCIIYR